MADNLKHFVLKNCCSNFFHKFQAVCHHVYYFENSFQVIHDYIAIFRTLKLKSLLKLPETDILAKNINVMKRMRKKK